MLLEPRDLLGHVGSVARAGEVQMLKHEMRRGSDVGRSGREIDARHARGGEDAVELDYATARRRCPARRNAAVLREIADRRRRGDFRELGMWSAMVVGRCGRVLRRWQATRLPRWKISTVAAVMRASSSWRISWCGTL